jgi:hypothetical protein
MSLTSKEMNERNATNAMRLMAAGVRLLRANDHGFVGMDTHHQVDAIAEVIYGMTPLKYSRVRDAIYEAAAADSMQAALTLTRTAKRTGDHIPATERPIWDECVEALNKIIYG